MPELPEVETVAGDLRAEIVGRSVQAARLDLPALLKHPDAAHFGPRIVGQRFQAVARHGKLLTLRLASGDGFYVHLGMTGRLTIIEPSAPVLPHTHLVLELDDGRQLRYTDPRRFGRLWLGTETELLAIGILPRLGPDPLTRGFTFDRFTAVLSRRRRPIKSALLDQTLMAGLGNIYADESCYLAGVRPSRRTYRLTVAERRALYRAIREVLRKSIRNRGSSVDDYRDGRGALGNHQHHLLVYGRAGAPCVRCRRALKKVRFAGRATVYCARCQR